MPLAALFEPGPKLLQGFNSNEEGVAQQQLLVVQQHSSRLVLLFRCCIHTSTFSSVGALLPNPHRIETLALQPKATLTHDDPSAACSRFLYVAATVRSQRPCLVCTSLLLTAGATILMLLSSEIGLAANGILFIPSSVRPLMHLEKYAI